MRRATAVLAPMLLTAGVTALGVTDRGGERSQRIGLVAFSAPVREQISTGITPLLQAAPDAGVTTTDASTTTSSPPAPPAVVGASPEDTDGPVLCPALRHPAHHRPCPRAATPVAAPRAPAGAPASPAPGDLLDALAECESEMNPSLNTGNGYYGAFQWLPRTWWSLTHDEAWKDSYKAVAITEILSTSYAGQKAVAALIPVSAWPGQFPGCSRKLGLA